MRKRFFAFCLSLFINEYGLAQHKVLLPTSFKGPISKEMKPFFELSKGEVTDLLKGEVISHGKVTGPSEKEQQLMLFVSAIHPRNCLRAMRKLSMYENYNQYMDFIKQSSYEDHTQKFSFTIDHALLPFPMLVKFKIPRIKDEGHYPFTFEEGFLKHLKGTVIVKNLGKYCLMGLKADWRGPETKIPNPIFGTFLETVGKIGLEHLIRVSIF